MKFYSVFIDTEQTKSMILQCLNKINCMKAVYKRNNFHLNLIKGTVLNRHPSQIQNHEIGNRVSDTYLISIQFSFVLQML